MLIHKKEMIQRHVAGFVLNRPWRRNCRDSITNMLLPLKRPSKAVVPNVIIQINQ